MRNQDKAYITGIFKYLKEKTGVELPSEEIIKGVDQILTDVQKNTYKSDPLYKYQNLYAKNYEKFMLSNCRSLEPTEKKAENSVYFHKVMDEIFTRIMKSEIDGYEFSRDTEEDDYVFGGMNDLEVESLHNRIYDKLTGGKDTAMNAFLKETKGEDPDYVEAFYQKKKGLESPKDLLAPYAAVRDHYENRSFISKWIFPSAYRERYIMNHIRETYADLTKDNSYRNMSMKDFDKKTDAYVNELTDKAADINRVTDKAGKFVSDYKAQMEDSRKETDFDKISVDEFNARFEENDRHEFIVDESELLDENAINDVSDDFSEEQPENQTDMEKEAEI